MKLHCGKRETVGEYIQRKNSWHRWFAWRPVRVGPTECRWLEFVERRKHLDCGYDGITNLGNEYRSL